MTEPRLVGDLEINTDPDAMRREWRFERIGWALMLAVAVASVVGAFGKGPLSHGAAGEEGSPLRVRYERLTRHHSPAPLELEVRASAGDSGLARVWIDQSYLERMDVDHIVPEPEAASAGADRTTYTFRITDPTRPGRIVFGFVPQGFGRARLRLGLDGGPTWELWQFVYP